MIDLKVDNDGNLVPHTEPVSDVMILELEHGNVKIILNRETKAHFNQITKLVKNGFYDGLKWHRVIDGFMAQTGCPQGTGTGNAGNNIPAEFSKLPFERGTVGMARAQHPDSASSQFFICFAPSPFLNGQYTVIGHVTSGMDVVDKIKRGNKQANGAVDNPDVIKKAYLAS